MATNIRDAGLFFAIVVVLCEFVSNAGISLAADVVKPNVLLIYTDDHRYSGVHALGGQQVSTPNLDSLAAEGIVFTNTYLMGSFLGATCVPSRACLMTGRDVFKHTHAGRTIPRDHTTIGEAFKNAGYHTHVVGKWHQDTLSLARSFHDGDTLMGISAYLTDHFRMPFWDWDPSGKFRRESAFLLQHDERGDVTRRALTAEDRRGPIGNESTGPHSSEVFADSAVRFIQSYSKSEPFFMYLAFHAPHDPRQAPRKYRDLYPVDEIELLPSYMSVHPFDNGDMTLRDEALAAWPRTPKIAKQQLADYYAIITHLDDQIGRVIKTLRDSGCYDNTLIVMAGDSGLAVGNHGLMGKQNVYDEDGVHVPFVLSGGRVSDHGRKIDALSYIHDIFPTVCDFAGISKPESVSGTSLMPVIRGEVQQVREHTFHAYQQFQRALRMGDHKLIEYVRANASDKTDGDVVRGSKVTQLFNYKNDPWETTNLASFPENQALVKVMQEKLKQVATELGDDKSNTNSEFDFWQHY